MIALLASVIFIAPSVATQPVKNDPDDPAIWRNRTDPEESRVFGTNKVKRPDGAIYAFDLDGKITQIVKNIDRPNNIDVLYDLAFPGGFTDIAVATERVAGRLRIFRIDAEDGGLTDATGRTSIISHGLAGIGEPMGVVCFRRNGRSYAAVSPKEGLTEGYFELYELLYNGLTNRVDAKFQYRFGTFSGRKEIESLAYNPFTQSVLYSDEGFGNRIFPLANPTAFNPNARLNPDFRGDHEGLDIWRGQSGRGYLVCTDQLPNRSRYRVLDLTTLKPVGDFTAGADETDGIAVESRSLGPEYPRGLMVVMDSKNKRFLYVDWRKVEAALHLRRYSAAVRTP